MKTITRYAILYLSLFILQVETSKAQFVTIPDTSFASWISQQFPSCINGNQLDTTCSSILFTQIMIISTTVTDLTGIKYFKGLNTLHCNSNSITNIPELPIHLVEFRCRYNSLSNLPTLPNTLQLLDCDYNQITSLPPLPSSLTELNCAHNQLTNLPLLPNNIFTLDCTANQLTSLQMVPDSMYWFSIANNNINCIPNLPFASYGNIANNPLTCVPNQTTYSLSLPICMANDSINNPNGCSTGSQQTSCEAMFYLVADSALQSVWYLVNQCIGSDSLPADSLSYQWSWGDAINSISTGAYPNFTYSSPGNYEICVTITDSTSGCTSTYCDSSTYINKLSSGSMIQVNVVSPNSPYLSGINALKNAPKNIRIFPNPSNGIFYLSNRDAMHQVDVYNLIGEHILTQQNSSSIDLTAQPKGVYIAKINGETMYKLLKE
jgi:hypothetical protein